MGQMTQAIWVIRVWSLITYVFYDFKVLATSVLSSYGYCKETELFVISMYSFIIIMAIP